MPAKPNPASLSNAVRGMRSPVKPNDQQRKFNGAIAGQSKDGLKRAQQLVKCRSFVYDGSLAPTCLACGNPRQDRRLLKCDLCEAAS